MASVPSVGRGFFPLDEELELLPGRTNALGHEQLVRVASWMPFERAAELYGDLTGMEISEIDEPPVHRASGSA